MNSRAMQCCMPAECTCNCHVTKCFHVEWLQLLEKLAVNHAMQRCAGPEEVAAPIVFLASDAASFITGARPVSMHSVPLGWRAD